MATETYHPTPAEARAHLRRWSRGRQELQKDHQVEEPMPRGWIPVAVDVVLDELERYEDANRGMVITSLEAVGDGEEHS